MLLAGGAGLLAATFWGPRLFGSPIGKRSDNIGLESGDRGVRLKADQVVVVLERCTDPRNYLSILKICLALGLKTILLVDPIEQKSPSGRNPFAAPTDLIRELESKLESHRNFSTVSDFLSHARALELQIWATDLSQQACELGESLARRARSEAATRAGGIALVFGREADGVSQTLLREADERVYFPLHGFSDSLNVSSSVALILDALIER